MCRGVNRRMGLVVMLSLPWNTEATLLQSSEESLREDREQKKEKVAYDVANAPQAGSTICFPIKVMKSN